MEEGLEEADLLFLFLVEILWNSREGSPSFGSELSIIESTTESHPYHSLKTKSKNKKFNKAKNVLKIYVSHNGHLFFGGGGLCPGIRSGREVFEGDQLVEVT